jgi:hypothetical protein
MYKLLNKFNWVTQKQEQFAVVRIIDTATIPFDPANTDFLEYQKWLAAGNTPIPADS